jgi:hypothetical protein
MDPTKEVNFFVVRFGRESRRIASFLTSLWFCFDLEDLTKGGREVACSVAWL